jgi:hypothetical protein
VTLVAGMAYCKRGEQGQRQSTGQERDVLERSAAERKGRSRRQTHLVSPGVLEERAGLVTRQDAGLLRGLKSRKEKGRGVFSRRA